MLKIILIACATSSFSTATVSPFVNLNTNTQISEQEKFIDFLRNDIEKSKQYLGSHVYSEYDNKIFTSQDELNEYILSNSIVESEFTSSNPNKIIKDYEHMTLDQNKIYDIDMNKFASVYRDAFGNIARTSQEALQTYTHSGLVKQKYSYDEEAWFDTPEEAKIHQKNNMKINKSLYYIYNNKYYNAFNLKDINNLLKTFNEGLFVNKTKSLEGNNLPQPIVEYGSKESIYKKMNKNLRSNFLDSYYYSVSEMDYKNSMEFSIKDENEFRIEFHGESKEVFKKGDSPKIVFTDKYKSKTQMMNDFKNINKWGEGNEGWGWWGRKYWYRDFDLIHPKSKKVVKATVQLAPKWKKFGGKNKPSFSYYGYEDKTTSTLRTYYDRSKNQLIEKLDDLPKRYSLQESSIEDKVYMYNAWFEEYFSKNIKNFGANENKDVKYEDILKENFIKNIDNSVYKDLIYDINNAKGDEYSLIKSYYDWLPVKRNLLNNPVDIDGKKMYQLKPDFYATKDQLDSFLQLQGKFHTILKYSFGDDPDLSSPDGKLLADTFEEAREKQFINANLSLKKKYLAYDVFGNVVESGNSEQEAINALRRTISLESKMTHKSEIESWNPNLKKSYDSIISDGRYLVYKLKDSIGNGYIYYASQEKALKAALANARLSGDVNKNVIEKYMYTYTDINLEKEYSIIFYNNNINEAIDKILLEIKSKKMQVH